MINTGFHSDNVWRSIIFQLMVGLYVMKIHNIYIKDFSIKNIDYDKLTALLDKIPKNTSDSTVDLKSDFYDENDFLTLYIHKNKLTEVKQAKLLDTFLSKKIIKIGRAHV